jgi:L-fuconolactonase
VTASGQGFVDAHVHFWDPGVFDYPWLAAVPELDRPFLPSDLPPDPDRQGIVFVQADCLPGQSVAEASWVHGLREAGAPVVGVVAHAPLERGIGSATVLRQLALQPLVSGVRRLLQDEADGFAGLPGFVAGVGLLARPGLTMDLCIRRHQLAEAAELVRRCPEVGFVLDHLGKPEVSPRALGSWTADLNRLSALPNVRCKLSGLATEADPDHRTTTDLRPYLRNAIDAFGPQRCMFGSDWPVLTTAVPYAWWLDLVREAVADLTADEQDFVLRRTAVTAYGLDPHPSPRPEDRDS